MNWIDHYQLYLLDFDGLLVNTEELHYEAYKRMLNEKGYPFDWNFDQYCRVAHYEAEGLEREIYKTYPQLKEKEPNWKLLHKEKTSYLVEFVQEGRVNMTPGAESFLQILSDIGIKRCVVTHSPDDLVASIRNQHPILNTIPFWITRHDYHLPKPNPECYQLAISKYKQGKDKAIGFEDTPRGLKALMGTEAKPILVCQANYPEIPSLKKAGVLHFASFDQLLHSQL